MLIIILLMLFPADTDSHVKLVGFYLHHEISMNNTKDA